MPTATERTGAVPNDVERTQFGVVLMPTDLWAESVAVARRVEDLGYDHLWIFDHLTWRHYQDRDWFGIYPWLAGMAASTSRATARRCTRPAIGR